MSVGSRSGLVNNDIRRGWMGLKGAWGRKMGGRGGKRGIGKTKGMGGISSFS